MGVIRKLEVFVTADRNLQQQQNIAERKIAIVALSTTSWPGNRIAVPEVVSAIDNAAGVLSQKSTYLDIDV